MKRVIFCLVNVVLFVISFMAGAAYIHGWWVKPTKEDEINPLKDEICKKHEITLIDENNNIYGKKRVKKNLKRKTQSIL